MSQVTPNGQGEQAEAAAIIAEVQTEVLDEGVTQETVPPAEQATEPAEQKGNAEEVISDDELLSELKGTSQEEPKVEQPKADDAAHAAHDLRMASAASKVKKIIESDGLDDKDAIAKLLEDGDIKADQANWLTKNAFGEAKEEEAPQAVDPKQAALETYRELQAQESATEFLKKAIIDNKLNVPTEEAAAKRAELIAQYSKSSKSLDPQEAAEFALFKSGLSAKNTANEAYEEGLRNGSMAAPPAGLPKTPSQTPVSEVTEENIDNLAAEDIEKIFDTNRAVLNER